MKPRRIPRLRGYPSRWRRPGGWCLGLLLVCAGAADGPGVLPLDSIPAARFDFEGPVEERVGANLDEWLLRAPQANPGMLGMFRVRDRKPVPQLVPWAGEFVGKYLISAVQALRLSDDPRLRAQVAEVVAQLISTQADDGYLGPFPQEIRLLRNWDLWGHYHVIDALLRWHEFSGDPAALAAARKAGDLVCVTYLDTGRRVLEAGDPEMNMAILTVMAKLHRLTGEPRYLRMAREVEQDWERAGDYLRAGLDGREFFQSPRPRWESFHDLQGLLELWRITGDPKYRDAFAHHWRSIRRWDRRNTGGFSSGEQATGNPYAPTAIETCCTVAWMALTVDYLRLTGDPRAADDLELATLNAGLGAQHPSGRWWTYNTPMDGERKASAHDIVFQARAGTPELNCCSVNGPRVLGGLGEWALMRSADGLVVNWLGAGTMTAPLADGVPVTLKSDDDAWRSGHATFEIRTGATNVFSLSFRIPGWARGATLRVNSQNEPDAVGPGYAVLRREWRDRDTVTLKLEMPVRAVSGANEAEGRVSLYRGPLLLAFDQAFNAFDEDAIPEVELGRLTEAKLGPGMAPAGGRPLLAPWLTVDVPTRDGRPLRLVNFASAGATGTRYRTWLPGADAPPAPAFTQLPRDGDRLPPGPTRFQWRGPRSSGRSAGGPPAGGFRIEYATNDQFLPPFRVTNCVGNSLAFDTRAWVVTTGAPAVIWWRVVTQGVHGETTPDVPAARFTLDPGAAPQVLPPEPRRGPKGELVVHSLRGGAPPAFGQWQPGAVDARDGSGTTVNGRDQRLRYGVGPWPDEDFTVAVRVKFGEFPSGRIGQVFSAWASSGDDPLRLVVENGKLFARLEAGGSFSTPGVPLEPRRWYTVAAVKQAGKLSLFVDGREVGVCAVPEFINTRASEVALGGNPHFGGNEFLAATFADFSFLARALAVEELEALVGAETRP